MILRTSIVLVLVSTFIYGQVDTGGVFTYTSFIEIVRANHPVVKQADLKLQIGDGLRLASKGVLDPKLGTDLSQKYFNDRQYYNSIEPGLEIPTSVGVSFNTGYSLNNGPYINPEASTPGSGLLYLGVEVPVLRGLLFDERRAILRTGEVLQQSSLAERRKVLNDLILQASQIYWEWYQSYHMLQIYQNVLSLSEVRYEQVRREAILGNRPGIDSVEAKIQVQNRLVLKMDAERKYQIASQKLSLFLWDNAGAPKSPRAGLKPITYEDGLATLPPDSLVNRRDSILINHPNLKLAEYAVNTEEINLRLKKEYLKPKLSLKYTPIAETVGNDVLNEFNLRNYKWGIDFSVPIFLRKERGEVMLAEAKLETAKFERENLQNYISITASNALSNWIAYYEQSVTYRETVDLYKRLLDGEVKKFRSGASSLFMVNSREIGYVNTQLKYLELVTMNKLYEAEAVYAFGLAN